jgi:hypothetical protein
MQKFHKKNEVKNILFSIWYFLFIGYQIIAGLFLFGVGLIVEFCKALKDMRKEVTIPPRYRKAKKHITQMDSRDAAMQKWRK